ncbi:hypothetical protein BC937DRAFT_93273 [Endogone sp. FLAS-F59071]|nr:hypothetical protein BC937DRAFT_93273 [Endogone sp. FLAS-F59071]|eukprot:RUS14821.1 hypothetical protein BC937DRAFT_93273 [Endogone sp. FLAS-F59071]
MSFPPFAIPSTSDYKCGDCICGDCGLIIESGLVDPRPEWRQFADDTEDPSRVGSLQNPFIDGTSLGATAIGLARSKGPGANRGTLERLQARQSSDELTLARGRAEIIAACHRMDLPIMVIDTAIALYRRCLEEQLQYGRAHINIIAAVIAQATRECNCERTIDVVAAQVSGCGDKEARRAIKAVQKRIEVGRISKVNPEAKIVDICKKLGLNNKVRVSAEELLRLAHNDGELFGSSKAATKAAACAFVAAMLWGHDVDMVSSDQTYCVVAVE